MPCFWLDGQYCIFPLIEILRCVRRSMQNGAPDMPDAPFFGFLFCAAGRANQKCISTLAPTAQERSRSRWVLSLGQKCPRLTLPNSQSL